MGHTLSAPLRLCCDGAFLRGRCRRRHAHPGSAKRRKNESLAFDDCGAIRDTHRPHAPVRSGAFSFNREVNDEVHRRTCVVRPGEDRLPGPVLVGTVATLEATMNDLHEKCIEIIRWKERAKYRMRRPSTPESEIATLLQDGINLGHDLELIITALPNIDRRTPLRRWLDEENGAE